MSQPRRGNEMEEWNLLRQCYVAFRERRSSRGRESIRTRSGFDLMCGKYQARVQFLSEKVDEEEEEQPFISQEIDDEVHPTVNKMTKQEKVEEMTNLRSIVGAYFDREIKKIVTQTWWPMAHLGGFATRDTADSAPDRSVPEWKELDFKRYLAVNTKMLIWLFPGLPTEEAQVLAERDWVKDVEFDAYGSKGMSFEGFCTSIIDLATACTDGTVEKCIEFLQLSSKWLCTTLAPFDQSLDTNEGEAEADGDPDDFFFATPGQNLPWKTIGLENFTRLEVKAQAQYIKLKAKSSVGMIYPLSLLLLATQERPMEVHFCTDMKRLLKDKEERINQRKRLRRMSKPWSIRSGSSQHFFFHENVLGPCGNDDDDDEEETEENKAALLHPIWSFENLQTQHSTLLTIEPQYFTDKKNPVVYGYIRLKEQSSVTVDASTRSMRRKSTTSSLVEIEEQKKDPQPQEPSQDDASPKNPTLSIYTSLQEPTPLPYGMDYISYGQVEQYTCRHFTLDHRKNPRNESLRLRFKIIPIHNKSPPRSPKKQQCSPAKQQQQELATKGHDTGAYHTYLFVIKRPLNGGEQSQGPAVTPPSSPSSRSSSRQRIRRKKAPCTRSQWQMRISGKETVFDIHTSSLSKEAAEEEDCTGLYLAYLFSFQSFYYEVLYYASSEHEKLIRQEESVRLAKKAEEKARRKAAEEEAIEAELIASGKRKPPRMPEVIKGKHVIPEKREIANNSLIRPDSILRSKFLTARATERRQRFVQAQERELHALHERILKKEKKIQWLRTQRGVPMAFLGPPPMEEQEINQEETNTQQVYGSGGDLVNNQMELMVAFFKEMAKIQPTKAEQSKDTNNTNSTATTNEVSVQGFEGLFAGEDSKQQLQEQQTKKKNSSKKKEEEEKEFSAEEYQSTGEYIEKLMGQVYKEQEQRKKQAEDQEQKRKAELESISAIIAPPSVEGAQSDDSEQMSEEVKRKLFDWVCSLEYAERRIGIGTCSDKKLEELERYRRPEWMTSSFIKQIGLDQIRGHVGTPFIPTHQTFEEQRQDLPWQALWQVESELSPVAVTHPRPPKTARASANTVSSLRASRPKTSIQSTVANAAVISYETTRMLRGEPVSSQRPVTVGTSPIRDLSPDKIPLVMNKEVNQAPDASCLVSILSRQAPEAEQDDRNSDVEEETLAPVSQEPVADEYACESDLEARGNQDALPDIEEDNRETQATDTDSVKPSRRGRRKKKRLGFQLPWSYMGSRDVQKPIPPSSVIEAKEQLLETSKVQPETIMTTPSAVSNGIMTRVVVHGDVYDVLLHHDHVAGIQRHQHVTTSRPLTTNTSSKTPEAPLSAIDKNQAKPKSKNKNHKTMKKKIMDPRLKELEQMLAAASSIKTINNHDDVDD